MSQEQRCVFFRLGAAVEMPVEQRKNAARRLKEFIALSTASLAAGHEPGHRRLAIDELLAGKAVGAHG